MQILICTVSAFGHLSEGMVEHLRQVGFSVDDDPTNDDFGLKSANPLLWRAHPAVIQAAMRSGDRAFSAPSCTGERATSKVVDIPDDVVWEIASGRGGVEFVREVHRTWK